MLPTPPGGVSPSRCGGHEVSRVCLPGHDPLCGELKPFLRHGMEKSGPAGEGAARRVSDGHSWQPTGLDSSFSLTGNGGGESVEPHWGQDLAWVCPAPFVPQALLPSDLECGPAVLFGGELAREGGLAPAGTGAT